MSAVEKVQVSFESIGINETGVLYMTIFVSKK